MASNHYVPKLDRGIWFSQRENLPVDRSFSYPKQCINYEPNGYESILFSVQHTLVGCPYHLIRRNRRLGGQLYPPKRWIHLLIHSVHLGLHHQIDEEGCLCHISQGTLRNYAELTSLRTVPRRPIALSRCHSAGARKFHSPLAQLLVRGFRIKA